MELERKQKEVGIPAKTIYAAPLHECVREVVCSLALLCSTVDGRANPQIFAYKKVKFFLCFSN
jgi:hypothetical protein